MKYSLLLILFILSSCSRPKDVELSRLLLADSLIKRDLADSALVLLTNIKIEELAVPESKALYALLATQAQDKNYILHTNDSLIRIAVDYYDKTENLSLRAKSHYYLGRVYQDMNDVRGVVREFLTAMPLAEEADDYYLTCLLQGNLGLLYADNGMLEEADSLYKCAGRLAKKKNDSIRWATALLNIGNIGLERGEKYYSETEINLMQALQIAKSSPNGAIVERKAFELLGCLYERSGEIPKAITFTKQSLELQTDSSQRYGGYLLLGSAYYKLELYDSATVYLNKSLYSPDNYTKEGAYMRLADIAKIQNRLEDAIFYNDKYNLHHRAALEESTPVKLVTSLYDVINQGIVNKYESFISQYKYYILSLFILLFFISGLYLVKQRRAKHTFKVLMAEKENLMKYEEQLRLRLKQKDAEIELLNRQCDDFADDQQEQGRLIIEQKMLLEDKELICSEICKLLLVKEQTIETLNKKYFKPIIEETPIFKKIITVRMGNCKNPDEMVRLDDSDWEELLQVLDNLMNDFTNRLAKKYVMLSKDDIRFCCLLKLGFKFGEMKDILACTLDAVYKREKAILKNKMNITAKAKLKEVINSI